MTPTLRLPTPLSLTLVAALVGLAQLSSKAQQPPPAATAPKSVVTLRIGDGTRTTYHLGEIVPAQLTTTGTDHSSFWVSAEPCETEQPFPVPVPPQTLEIRNSSGISLCMGHGWGGNIDITDHPLTTGLLLNKRYRLNKPGTYTLVWNGATYGNPKATSNTATFTILPRDPAWQAAELARADDLLDHPPAKPGRDPAADGCAILRYLDTPAAVLDMAHRFDRPNCSFNHALESATPKNRTAILAILNARLLQPDDPISRDFLSTLANISFRQSHPEYFDGDTLNPSPSLQSRGSVGFQEEHLQQQAELHRVESLLAANLSRKPPGIRAQCIHALLQTPRISYLPQSLTPDVLAAIHEQLPPVFFRLGDMDQNSVIATYWPDVASPAMEPILHIIIEQDRDLVPRAQALHRLYQLNPAKARAYILEDLQKPQTTFAVEALSQLPDDTLPEIDPLLLQRATDLAHDPKRNPWDEYHNPFQLLARYASPAIEPRVRALILEGPPSSIECGERFDLMAYLHRVDPTTADALLPQLADLTGMKTTSPGHTGPYHSCTFEELASRYWSPAIEAAELAQLDNPDSDSVATALKNLQLYASPSARPVILQHFRQWHEKWKSQPLPNTQQSYPVVSGRLDNSYLQTLLDAYGWNTSLADIKAYGELCLNQGCHDEASRRALSYNPQNNFITYNAHDGLGPCTYAMYPFGGSVTLQRLEQKIALYPPGAGFGLDTRSHRPDDAQPIINTLGTWMSAHGYLLNPFH